MMPLRHRTFFPPSPPKFRGLAQMGSRIQLQQRNCSRFSRDFLHRSTFPSSQRTGKRTSDLRFESQDYLITQVQLRRHVERSREIPLWGCKAVPRDSSTLLGMTTDNDTIQS